MDYRIEAACGSHMGRVRSNNEDNFLFDGQYLPQENRGQTPPLQLYGEFDGDLCMGVFDGMGGAEHGELASFTAARAVKGLLSEEAPAQLREFLDGLCGHANRAVWDAQTQVGTHNMGTTLALLYFRDSQLHAVNLGDSRIFGLREDRMLQISADHTDEAYMKARGITDRRPRLTQFLGMDPGQVRLEPHIAKAQLRPGDIYLVCSDGLTDMVSPEQIRQLLSASGTAAACVEALINAALEQGGRDNVTVIVCRVLEQTKPWREEDDGSKDPLAQLADHGLSWGRKLWQGIQDRAKNIRRN